MLQNMPVIDGKFRHTSHISCRCMPYLTWDEDLERIVVEHRHLDWGDTCRAPLTG